MTPEPIMVDCEDSRTTAPDAPDEADAKSAADIRAVLRKRWPDTEYVVLEEAPAGDPMMMGRKLDMVAISAWRSRGFALDGVEIKVSMGDWRRELKDAAKADWWWRHVDRFWLAVPALLALKVEPEVPHTWGILACTQTLVRVVRQAPLHDRQEMTWPAMLALLRCARGAGVNAIHHARTAGYDEGREAAKREFEHQTGDAYLRKQLADLKKTIDAFSVAAGQDLDCYSAADLGAEVRMLRSVKARPRWVRQSLEAKAAGLEDAARQVREWAKFAELQERTSVEPPSGV